jgi:5-formyltetrahydrofolate cyclo-ligase
MAGDPEPIDAALSGAALREAKLALRRQALAARDRLSADVRAAASAAIAGRIAALPSFAAARTVLLTLAFRSEWDTLPLVRAALAAGKTVAVPRVNAGTRMLELHAIADPARDVAPGHQGIPEPLPHCPRVAPDAVDWVLVPGVTFDRAGRRLGYGGGYYDRLLAGCGPAVTVGVCFEALVLKDMPLTAHDLPVDHVVTEVRGVVACRLENQPIA